MPSRPIRSALFGMLAVRSRFITQEQLDECLAAQKEMETRGGPVPKLGEVLEQRGYLTRRQVETLLESRAAKAVARRFGEIAAGFQFLPTEQVEAAAEMQEMLGRGATETPLTGNAQGIYRAFLNEGRSGNARPKLGEILVALGQLRRHQVEAVLDEQGKRFSPCPFCQATLNIQNLGYGQRLRCAQCGALLEGVRGTAGDLELAPPPATQFIHRDQIETADAAEPARPAAPPPPARATGTGAPLPQKLGDFRIVTRLGEDGTGTIVKAVQISKDRPVALKVMRNSAMQDAAFQARWLEEAKRAAALEHPNIKKILAAGKYDGRYCVATEFFEAESVYSVLQKQGPIGWESAVRTIRPVMEALAYAHRRGVVHGDLRPSQILITRDGTVKLANLGMASRLSENILAIAETGQAAPFYVAPELVTGDRETDHRVDIYSLGATLFHMISGKPPYKGKSYFEVLVRLSQEQIPPLQFFDPTIPARLTQVVHRMLDPEPDNRYETLEQVLADLDEIRASGPASGAGGAFEEARGARRGRLAAAAVLAVAVIAVLAWWRGAAGDRREGWDGLRRKAQVSHRSRSEFAAVRAQLDSFARTHAGSDEAAAAEREMESLRRREDEAAQAELAEIRAAVEQMAGKRRFGEALGAIENAGFWKAADAEVAPLHASLLKRADDDWAALEAEAVRLASEGKHAGALDLVEAGMRARGFPADAARRAPLESRMEAAKRRYDTEAAAARAAREEEEAREREKKQREDSAAAWREAEAEFERHLAKLELDAAAETVEKSRGRLVAEDAARAAARLSEAGLVRDLLAAAAEDVVEIGTLPVTESAPDGRLRVRLKAGGEARAGAADATGLSCVDKAGTTHNVAWGDLDPAAFVEAFRRGAKRRNAPRAALAAGVLLLARGAAEPPATARAMFEEAERQLAAAARGGLAAESAAAQGRVGAWFDAAQAALLERAVKLVGETKYDEASAFLRSLRNLYGRRPWTAAHAAEIDRAARDAAARGAAADAVRWFDFASGAAADLKVSAGWKAEVGTLAGSGENEEISLESAAVEELAFLVRFARPDFRLTVTAGDFDLRLDPSRDRFDALVRREGETPLQKSLKDRFAADFQAREWHHVRIRLAAGAAEVFLDGASAGSIPFAGSAAGVRFALSGASSGQAGVIEVDELLVRRR